MPGNHRCHATHCDLQVPPALFVCLNHWRSLDLKDKRRIHETYRPGQEIDKLPSQDYINAAEGAIHRLHIKLGEDACILCVVCIKAGKSTDSKTGDVSATLRLVK